MRSSQTVTTRVRERLPGIGLMLLIALALLALWWPQLERVPFLPLLVGGFLIDVVGAVLENMENRRLHAPGRVLCWVSQGVMLAGGIAAPWVGPAILQ